MKAFETIRTVDPDSGVENWRAYFLEAVIAYVHGDAVIKPDVPVGRGDTELEAIANLCIKEDERLEQEARNLAFYEARLAPMTQIEWECLDYLYREGTCWGVNTAFHEKAKNDACWVLTKKGYVDRNSAFYISEEGIDYYEQHSSNRQRVRYS